MAPIIIPMQQFSGVCPNCGTVILLANPALRPTVLRLSGALPLLWIPAFKLTSESSLDDQGLMTND
jgi:hypothetical protein